MLGDDCHPPLYVYIGGYGRSGTTIVDLYLAAQQVFSVGEFICFERNLLARKPCSCGKPLDSCGVWSDLARQFVNGRKRSALEQSWLIGAIKKYGAVVESSKTAWNAIARALFLLKRIERVAVVKYLHVFRHPYHVMLSINKGSNKLMETTGSGGSKEQFLAPARALVNFYLSIFGLFLAFIALRRKVVVMDFDDFCRNDDYRTAKLRKVDERFTGCKRTFNITHVWSSHMVDGNRLRRRTSITLESMPDPSLSPLNFDGRLCAFLMLPGYFLLRRFSD